MPAGRHLRFSPKVSCTSPLCRASGIPHAWCSGLLNTMVIMCKLRMHQLLQCPSIPVRHSPKAVPWSRHFDALQLRYSLLGHSCRLIVWCERRRVVQCTQPVTWGRSLYQIKLTSPWRDGTGAGGAITFRSLSSTRILPEMEHRIIKKQIVDCLFGSLEIA